MLFSDVWQAVTGSHAFVNSFVIYASLTSIFAILITGYALFQIYFHPLARYPGPVVAKLTSLWSVYHAFRGDRHLAIFELHKRYGTVVRIGPHDISINSANALGPIYGHDANAQKSHNYKSFYGNSLLTAIDKKVYGRKKRVMLSAFSDQALRSMETYVLSAIRDWCSALGRKNDEGGEPVAVGAWSAPRDMALWSTCVVFDILGEVCFGRSFDTSLRDDNRWFFTLMSFNMYVINIISQMPVLRSLGVEAFLRRGTAASRQRQVAFAGKQIRTRMEAEKSGTANRRDIIYYLLRARDPETGEGYSDPELMGEVIMLLAAGTDTAGTALASTFYYLTQHPAILARVTHEVRSTFPDLESIISGPSMQKMTYLRACLEEAMRLSPPIPTILPREVLAGGLHIDQHFFPAGTIIGVPTYTLHHNSEYFSNPFSFQPERWLLQQDSGFQQGEREGVTAEQLAIHKRAFMAFSTGPRVCPGRSLAFMELELALTRALWLYNIRLASEVTSSAVGAAGGNQKKEEEGEYKIRDHFAAGKEGPVLQFQKRI